MPPLVAYIARRVLLALVTIYVVVTISFYMVRLMPGNPMSYLEGELVQQGGMTPQEIQAKINAVYGVMPTGPVWLQYLQYVGDIFRGNFGYSILNPGESVLSIIAGAIPWTLLVVAVALLISFAIGIVIGTLMAANPESRFAKFTTGAVSFLSAIPNYIVALTLIYLFADQHRLFPASGAYSVNTPIGLNPAFIGSVAYHAILPIASYVIVSLGGWALTMKGSVSTILGADYVRAAESWGLSGRRITESYIGRNAMLPMVTNLALSLGYLFGGSVFIETYFIYPGIGYYLIQAVNSRDYSLMMGCFILITVAVVISNMLVDLLYPLVDPRIVSPAAQARSRQRRTDTDETTPAVAATGGTGV
jgi:peptide/nickel transport system permease protein